MRLRTKNLFNFSKLRELIWSWYPRSEREASDAVVTNFLLHWFPVKVSKRSLSFTYSFWLGTISFVLFLILTVTGVILMFYYVPSVERAYGSVKDIEYAVSFGGFIRALHRIAAHLMVISVFLHMVRVFLTTAYKNGIGVRQNRPLNFVIGVFLLLATLLLSFTGYLLPWDQLAYWAITVGTNIARAAPLLGEGARFVLLGGNEIGQNTLIRFYVLHVFFLPVFVFILFLWHMWRVRKDGGLACDDKLVRELKSTPAEVSPAKTYSLLGITQGRTVYVEASVPGESEHFVNSVPHLTRRILLVTLATILVSCILAVIFQAPLEEPANPALTPNPAKAPWYFLWLQELVAITTVHLGPITVNGALVGGVIIPTILVVLLIFWPYIDKSPPSSVGVWFARERLRQNIVFILICLAIIVLILIASYMRGPYWDFYWPWETWPPTPVSI